ncbi:MAG: hypothetical protein ACP5DX_04270 [Paracoccaceae bacterium]
MVEYGTVLSGTSGGGGGGFSTTDISHWAEAIVRDPTYLLIAGGLAALIFLLVFAR